MGLLSRFAGTARPAPVNIADPAFKANPFPYYARLRDESPVVRVTLPTREAGWLVTRYDDVAAVLKDDRFVKDTANALSPEQAAAQPWFRRAFKVLKRNMLQLDPPDHTRLRGLVNVAFTPRLVEQMRGRVQELADDLLDAAARRGTADLVRDFALPLPTTVIAEVLGVPAADREKFHRWSTALVAASASNWALLRAVPGAWALMRYIRGIVRRRRADPRDDLTTALVRAEAAGDRLTEDELLAMIFLLLIAGHETTVNLIAGGLLALLEHPAQLDRLRADPGLIKPAVEELLRFVTPVDLATERYTAGAVAVGGVTIPRGEMVYAVLGSANHDERQFPDPESLDVGRDPNRHLAFGLGTHFCLGASLARLEGQVALGTLVRRFPGLRLAVAAESLPWRRGILLRGLEALPVVLGPGAG
ncbi:MAG TPA: cytochrome P450 [Gemmataceae bacterium]|jgi:cytochrome P450 PksS